MSWKQCIGKVASDKGGALSTLLFLISVAPFLAALSNTAGVNKVFGFCDDWEAVIRGLRPVSVVRRLVEDFENASVQQ